MLLLSLAIWLTACGGAPHTLKVGLVAPFEGLERQVGYDALSAVKLAIQQRNEAGGVSGYQIQLVALNDLNQPELARQQAQALLTDPDVVGVVGHFSELARHTAQPIYERGQVIFFSPTDFSATGQTTSYPSFASQYQTATSYPPPPHAFQTYEATQRLLDSLEQVILHDRFLRD